MKSSVIKNLVFAAAMIVPWLAIDFIWVKTGQDRNSIGNNRIIQTCLLGGTVVGFFLINRSVGQRVAEPLRLIVPLGLALLIAAVLAYLGMIILVNFHMAIGGKI